MKQTQTLITRRLRVERVPALSGHGNVASIVPVAHADDFDTVRLRKRATRIQKGRGF